jgi:hypothetical protein
VTDYLFHLEIRVLFGSIIVEYCLKLIDEIMLIVRYLKICHDNVIGSVGPIVIALVIYAISLAGKI